jgi:hypothetical protein
MRIISLLLQLLASHQTMVETKAFMESARGHAEKSKRMAAFSAACMAAFAFIVLGITVALVAMGMQYEEGNVWRLGGILAAGLSLIGIGAFIVALSGWLILERDHEEEVKAPVKAKTLDNQDLRAAIEDLGITFIKQFAESMRDSRTSPTDHKTRNGMDHTTPPLP